MATTLAPAKRAKLLSEARKAKRGDLTRIANDYDVAVSVVSLARKAVGLKPLGPGRPKGLSKKMEARRSLIVAAVKDGATAREVAKKFKVSRTRIYQICQYGKTSK
jgi:hypothetical protein